jgi:ribosomal protein L28
MPPSRWFKRSQEGLFGGKGRLTGHTISPSKRQYVLAVLEFDTLPLANHFYSPLLLAGASFIFTSAFFFCSVKRVWVPNVQRKSIWSDALGKCLSLKVTTFALREMDRMG